MDLLPHVPPIYHAFYNSLHVNNITMNPFEEVDKNTDILELHCVNEDGVVYEEKKKWKETVAVL